MMTVKTESIIMTAADCIPKGIYSPATIVLDSDSIGHRNKKENGGGKEKSIAAMIKEDK